MRDSTKYMYVHCIYIHILCVLLYSLSLPPSLPPSLTHTYMYTHTHTHTLQRFVFCMLPIPPYLSVSLARLYKDPMELGRLAIWLSWAWGRQE